MTLENNNEVPFTSHSSYNNSCDYLCYSELGDKSFLVRKLVLKC